MGISNLPKYKLQDLIDIAHFQDLQDSFNDINPFTSAILDNDGNILTASGWQDICTKFYRVSDKAKKECTKSDAYINDHLHEANPSVCYKCLHGLVDSAIPIIVDGVHYGNFFTGQFFFEEPDLDFFREQARIYGFDEESFLSAVKRVPIITTERLNGYLRFFRGLIATISESAIKKLKQIEAGKQVDLTERRIGAMIKTTNDGFWTLDIDANLIDVNEAYARMSGYGVEELLRLNISDLEAKDSFEERRARFEQATNNGSVLFETQHRKKDGTLFDVEMSGTFLPGENPQFVCFCRDISARKRDEEALRHKTALLEAQLNASVDGILVVDSEGKKIIQNRRMVEIWKIPAPVAENPDDAFQVEHVMGMTKNPEQFVEKIKYLYGQPDESSHDFVELADDTVLERYSAPVIGDDGKHYGRIWTFHDITERMKSEEALFQSERKYSSLFNSMLEGFALHEIICDGEGKPVDYRFLDMNPAYEKMTGMLRSEVVGKTVLTVLPSTESYWIKKYGEVALTGEPVSFENFSGAIDRSYHVIAFSPKKHQFAVIISDVTERRKSEEAIAAEKEWLAVTLRSIGDGVITTDTKGIVVKMNKVAEDLTGWIQAEAQGKPLSVVFNSIDETSRTPLENPVEKVLATGLIIEQLTRTLLVSKDGTERHITDSAAPIKDKDSKTIGVVLVFRDMTEKQKMLDNMQRIDKLDSIGVLAGGIAHDFNNLLGGIFGYLDMAREECAQDSLALKYLDKAMTVFDRAKDLTQQLLTFSKGGVPKRKTGNIGTLVRENAAFVLSGTNVSCAFEIEGDLNLCDYDENQIGQVIDNIVLNAQQAMPLGGTITISVHNVHVGNDGKLSLPIGDYIEISIRDTGVGIPQEMLKRIFDPFFTTKQKGNGLGLATCYSIVQKHDGYIDVESVPGKGSTFRIFLPASHTGSLQYVPQTATEHKGKGSILVMDDEDFMREIVVDMLGVMGYSAIEAKNGEEAISLCADAVQTETQVRAAFFDLTIPGGMGGKEAIVTFREKFPDIPVFAASGFSEDPVMARPAEFGFTDSIRKPFKKNELAEMLNRHFK